MENDEGRQKENKSKYCVMNENPCIIALSSQTFLVTRLQVPGTRCEGPGPKI